MPNLLSPREGRTQLQTLSGVVYYESQSDGPGRVTDLSEVLPLSKGAVSNNTKKLLEQDLIVETDKRFTLNDDKLLELYREHLEQYLVREAKSDLFSEEIRRKNKARTRTKKKLEQWLEHRAIREMLREILVQSLLTVREQSWLQTLREVFLYADRLVRKTHEEIEEEMWEGKQKGSGGDVREAFDHLAQCIDWGTSRLDPVFERLAEGTPVFEDGELRSEIKQKLETFCEANGIRKLTLFGSAGGDEFSPISDIDIAVEFQPGETPGLDFFGLERELEDIFQRKVDLVTEDSMSDRFRSRALEDVEVLYEAA